MIFIILYREKNIQNKCLHYLHADLTLKSFLFFTLHEVHGVCLIQRIVTHDYTEKCLCGGSASWADKTSDLSVTTSPGSILYCDVLKKIYTSNVYFILQSAVGGMGGWGGVGRVCRAAVGNPRSTLLTVNVSMPFPVARVHTQELLPESVF